MKNSMRIKYTRIKQLPNTVLWLWILLGLLILCCVVQLFYPPKRTLENLQNYVIKVDKVSLIDTHDTKGSRMRLEIVSEDLIYYVWYPQSTYLAFSQNVEQDLLSGNTSYVEVKCVSKQTLRDKLLGKRRVVDLKNSNRVYYDQEIERVNLQQQYYSILFLTIVIVLIWVAYTILISMIYGILKF